MKVKILFLASTKRKIFKVLSILGKILLGILVFLLLVILFIRSPWGQNLIKDKFISKIEEKTNAKIDLGSLYIEFNGDISIDDLYIEDPKGDTLIYSKSLSASIPILPLIQGNSFSLNDLDWKEVRANIIRKDSISGFNYEFLMNAFGSDTTQTSATPADTAAAPMEINLGDFNLKDFDVVYRDDVSGIDTKFKFDRLELELTETDLQNMVFRANDAIIENARITYEQTKPFPESDEEPPPLPVFSVNNLEFKNIKAEYISQPDSLDTAFDIADLQLNDANFDLKNNVIRGSLLHLKNSEINIAIQQRTTTSGGKAEESGFTWPEWDIQVDKIDLANNSFDYFVNGKRPQEGRFNPNAISADSLTLIANNFSYKEKSAEVSLDKFQFKEASGIALNKLDFDASISDEMIAIEGLGLSVNNNILSGDVELTYQEMEQFINNPGDARMNLNLDEIRFNVNDIYRFQPALRENQYLDALDKAPVTGRITANGYLKDLNLQNLSVDWNNTSIRGSGNLKNLQDPENIGFDLNNVNARTNRSDLKKFVKEEDIGIRLPEQINLTGSFSGNTANIRTDSRLVTSEGSLKINGNFKTGDDIVFDAKVQGDSIALGTLLQNEALGDIGLNIEISGSGNTVNSLDANFNSQIISFTYKDYEFRDIEINGDLEDGKGPVTLTYKDNNLNMQANTNIELDTVAPRIEFNVEMQGADLGDLEITTRSIKTGFTLEGWFEGNSQSYEAKAEIIDGIAVYNNETYLLGNFEASAYVRPDTTSVTIDNKILDLRLRSNASPAAFSSAIDRHFKRYISEDFKEDSITNPVNLSLNAKIREAPILTDVFLVNLTDMDTMDINIDFREKQRELNAAISIPYVDYFSSQIDSLKLDLNSDPEDLNFQFAFNSLNTGPLAIKKTIIDGKVLNRKLNLDFTSLYEDKRIVHVNSELNFQGDTLRYHINPQDFILNSNPWNISSGNQINVATEYLSFDDFRMFRDGQELRISNNSPGVTKEHLRLDFDNFKLAPLLSYLNPEEKLATGKLNGKFIYEEPFGETGIIADLQINQFKVLDVDLNTLSLDGNSSGFNNYEFDLAIKGGEVDLDLSGTYAANETAAELDLDLNLNEVKMSAVEGFSQGAIKNSSGSFSGDIALNGTLAEPQYDGTLNFNQARFNISYLNTAFILPDEQISLNQDAVNFNDFEIKDPSNNSFIVNGQIITENLLNPGFDLNVQATDFQVLNSSKGDNELFYGQAVVDVDADISGDLNLPVINMDLEINESTDFTYIVPETELQIKERDGVVIFVNKENPDAILSETEEESYVVSGYDIKSRLNVNRGAQFSVIINPETGDKFQVQGEGDLIFNMYPNGRLSLTGVYEINDGFYEMSLYNLVKRRFDIVDGSRVSWAGDPFEAQMDVRALYRVETSASSLMASQISGADQSVSGRFRQELPFYVYLNVDGGLMEPKITFSLDMPEDEQGAIGGQVYGRIQQLNNQEQELNKQVFSLLVLNRFFPAGGNDGSSGGTLAVARDNLNDALSDQLNALSGRLLGNSGVQLNFQVDSYTDYQGENPEERTQLDISAQKAFLDDRLIVQVGSEVDIQGGNQPGQEASPVIGNVSIAYLLDEDGTWRLKGFRKNQYENVIDGQLIVSGIALIFTKEFNKFKNIFEKAVMEKVQKEKEENQEKNQDENQTESDAKTTNEE